METRTSNFEFGRITGVFESKEKAEEVFDALRDRGYAASEIDLVMTDETRSKYYGSEPAIRTEMGDKAMEGAGVGSAIGGTLGAIVGAIAAIGTTLVLPGIGLVVAGPIAAALAGAGAGGLTGGLLGALVGSGIPEDQAQEYESRIKEGGTAIAIQPRSSEDAAFVRDLFTRNSNGMVYDEHYNAKSQSTSEPDMNRDSDTTGQISDSERELRNQQAAGSRERIPGQKASDSAAY